MDTTTLWLIVTMFVMIAVHGMCGVAMEKVINKNASILEDCHRRLAALERGQVVKTEGEWSDL